MAKIIVEQNEKFLGKDITDRAKNIIDRNDTDEKGGRNDEQEKKKTTRRTRKTT